MLIANIMMSKSLHFVVLIFLLDLAGCADDSFKNCATILPDSIECIPVELGKEFTAVCNLPNDSEYSAEDIEWFFGNVSVPKKFYTTLNQTAVALTVNVSRDMKDPLKCKASKKLLSYEAPCIYGIYLDKGYPPEVPKNVSCIALQDNKRLSPILTCSWDPGTRDPLIHTNYTLYLHIGDDFNAINATSNKPFVRNLSVNFGTFPNHVLLRVYVEAKNKLQTVRSKELNVDSEYFVKPNPPSNVRLIPEVNFPTSLIVNWTHPIDQTYFKVSYNVRYCQAGSSVWTEVNQTATKDYIESFRLQQLQPYTEYVVQVRCIHDNKNMGYWSEWSPNVTAHTPEYSPQSRPDLWRVYEMDSSGNPAVKLIWKNPVKSNGLIMGYNITIDGNSSESHDVHSKEHFLHLKGEKIFINMTVFNSIGASPPTTLVITQPGRSLHNGVKEVKCSVHDGQLWVNWLNISRVSEYLIEWVSVPHEKTEWQRVSAGSSNASIKGNLEPFKRYNISVYPIYRVLHSGMVYNLPGKPVSVSAYLQEGSPLSGPSVEVTATEKSGAHLTWEEIPIDRQRGFLTSYTIFYRTGDNEQFVVVGPEVLSHKLTGLASNSQYVVHIMASNIKGSKNGSSISLHTKEYDDTEIELTVVLVCLGFLLIVVFIMMILLRKRKVIKKHFWPQVPDPSHSTIAKWSPDCPTKADSPKEATMVDVSVVQVDTFDENTLCEENKVALPLKKDKYLPEENSSGIGGSSCMSSPRQSVSSSDEADSGQTTASTVQYSSVVASGYKGQTPSAQGAMFSRSESTQPLLDCEENADHLSEASSPLHTNSYFRRPRGIEQLQGPEGEPLNFGSLTFSPTEEEDTPTLTEEPPGLVPDYMPQQSGYRPQ